MSQFQNNERGVHHTAAAAGGFTYGESPASGPAPTTAGHHTHDVLNKLDPRIDSTHDKQPMQTSGNGPHSSHLANILDPRVDSKTGFDKRAAGASGAAGAATGPAMHGGAGTAAGAPGDTYGPHSSRIANAIDPRVDSDMDNRGSTGTGPGYGANTATGYGQGHTGAGFGHNSNAVGYGQPGYGQDTTGYGQPTGGLGQHQPGVGVGHHGVNNHGVNNHGAMSGPGATNQGAGPHSSSLLNKLDPRVDSTTGAMKSQEARRGI